LQSIAIAVLRSADVALSFARRKGAGISKGSAEGKCAKQNWH
jgi:hypothetical protein